MKRSNWYHFLLGGVLSILLFIVLSHILSPFINKLLFNSSRISYFIGVNTSFIILAISFLLMIYLVHGLKPHELITEKEKISYKRFFKGFTFWITALLIPLVVGRYTHPELVEKYSTFKEMLPFLGLALIFTPIQIAIEEIIFRSYLVKGLSSIKNNRIFIITLSSVFFAILHMWNPEVKDKIIIYFLIYFGMALFLVFLATRYKGIEYCMGIHYANNFFAIIFLNYKDSPLPTSSLFYAEDASPLNSLISFIITAVIVIVAINYTEKKSDKKHNI